jgi:di/tricarboxylate transporter
MTWDIAFVLLLLGLAFLMFVSEKVSPDVTALSLFAILLVTGKLPQERILGVLANPAPLTIGAMFILSGALVKAGAMERLANLLAGISKLHYFTVVLLLTVGVGAVSAFINNTPVVVVLVPVVLALAARMQVPASKLLIPLSYAAVLGGVCTLIGTSTNLVVSGIAQSRGQPPFEMFELAYVGLPLLAVGAVYVALFGWRILPVRESLTGILTAEERREYFTEMFVRAGSAAVGQTLDQAGLVSSRGVRVIELVRDEVALPFDTRTTTLAEGDRLILSCRPKGVAHARSIRGLDLGAEMKLPLEQISAHEGVIIEGVVGPNSDLIGATLREINFRQRYRMVVLAVHRRGESVREDIGDLPLQLGDILLMMGTEHAVERLRSGPDLLLVDRPPVPSRTVPRHLLISIASILGIMVVSTLGLLPIEVAAVLACVVVLLTGCIKPKEAYRAVEWDILVLIYGMLAVGLAMEDTGTTAYLVDRITWAVAHFTPIEHKPLVMLAVFYLTATILTEVLSNNAVAALMAPLAIGVAAELGVDARPFLIALCIAASAAFATPIGYQTNTYVYGIGAYRFSDFVKFGLPLNFLCFAVAIYLIPRIWPF